MFSQKMRLMLVAIAAIVITWITQPTLAYYTMIGTATNVVTLGNIKLAIHEKTADGQDFPTEGVYVIPGDIVSKIVTVENVCGHPFYLRVKLVGGATHEELTEKECLEMDLNTESWTLQSDGYLYYNAILQPGESTAPVFTQVEILGQYVNQNHLGSVLTLTVRAEAVQSENNPAEHPWDASGWPAA